MIVHSVLFVGYILTLFYHFVNKYFVFYLFSSLLSVNSAILFTKQPGGKWGRNRNWMIWRNVFRMRGCARQVPFQNPGTSKGLKKCLNAKRHSGQLAFAQTIPSHRLTTFFHPLRSSSRFLQSHMPHTSPHPERFIKTSASLPSHFPSEAQ